MTDPPIITTQQRRLLLKPDPLGVPRNPLAVYLLALCLVSGIVTASGLAASKAIDEQMPHLVDNVWGGMLTFGSGATLLGMFWPGLVNTGLLLKRVGTFSLAVASFIYATVIVLAAGRYGLFNAGLILGFGLACGLQCLLINRRVAAIIQASKGDAL